VEEVTTKTNMNHWIIWGCFATLLTIGSARIHTYETQNDARRYIALSTFGFYKGGVLDVQLVNFTFRSNNKKDNLFGFSVDQTFNDAMNPYLDTHTEACLLRGTKDVHVGPVIFFIIDFNTNLLQVNCSNAEGGPHIYRNQKQIPGSQSNVLDEISRVKRQTFQPNSNCMNIHLPITNFTQDGVTYYNTGFVIYIASNAEEGLYNLYFYSCGNVTTPATYDFTIKITESNIGGYLSAGEMPLPALYCTMSILFFLSGCFWVFLLRQSRHPIFKLHYLMAALVFLKALSLAFHGVNYHFIETLGVHLATWAILFYIAHLLKGALLFITLVLVGTGWTFIKHVLAPRDRLLFMAVIPLQVLANIAKVIFEESEEGSREHDAWNNIFILVDLLCCGCILFPVVWSIRHLQEASQTSGKAAINLQKLKLFRHFYVMIVCYIYFTRIIVYLLRITVPFQYGWLDEMCSEMATYVFFVLTGYKFRPASSNPYFTNTSDDEDEDVVYSVTETGYTEGLSKVNSRYKPQPIKAHAMLTEVTEEETESLMQKESSHEYD